MKTGTMLFAGAVAVLLAASNGLQAQAPSASTPSQDASKAGTVQLTGCLAKGTDANSFMLNDATTATAATTGSTATTSPAAKDTKVATTGSEAKTYHLMPKDTVKMADHVGHKIEVTGTMDKKGAGAEKTGTAGTTGTAAGKSSDAPHVTVTAIKHIAAKCE